MGSEMTHFGSVIVYMIAWCWYLTSRLVPDKAWNKQNSFILGWMIIVAMVSGGVLVWSDVEGMLSTVRLGCLMGINSCLKIYISCKVWFKSNLTTTSHSNLFINLITY